MRGIPMKIYDYDEFYKKLDSLRGEIQKRAKEATRSIANAENPGLLGVYKGVTRIKPKGIIYAYEINQSYRILYIVMANGLGFIRVGDHKVAYGKD